MTASYIETNRLEPLKSKLDELQRKARERTVKTQNIEYDLDTLVKKIKAGVITLDPEYQRRHRWSKEISSGLIESLILNIPIPPIYISQDIDADDDAATETAKYSVIDGQQRLTAIRDYLQNDFPLVGLAVLADLNGSFYKDLPPFLIRRLEERTLRCLRIDSTVDTQVKYDIFERLNSGSVKLEAQELRNAILRGDFNNLLKHLAENEDFRALLQIKRDDPESNSKVQKMADVELVLRFFSLSNGKYTTMKKGFGAFLSEQMEAMNKLDKENLLRLRDEFLATMRLIRAQFGDKAFAKYRDEDGGLKMKSTFNAAVYDSLSVAVHDTLDFADPKLPAGVAERFKNLFRDPTFFASLEGGVSIVSKIATRIDAAKGILV